MLFFKNNLKIIKNRNFVAFLTKKTYFKITVKHAFQSKHLKISTGFGVTAKKR